MTWTQKAGSDGPQRGLLARPLEALVFLLPLLIFHEGVALTGRTNRVIAFELLRGFFELFGHAGRWLPALGVIAILIATHVAAKQPWAIRWQRIVLMYVEAAALAIPLLVLHNFVPLAAGTALDRVAQGVGAGIYEELVFRLVLISLIVIIGVDIFKMDRTGVAVAAVMFSALAFAAHHHKPFGVESFDLTRFTFRSIAGGYLAIIFWYRGYGPAAGCHAAYNVALVSFAVFR